MELVPALNGKTATETGVNEQAGPSSPLKPPVENGAGIHNGAAAGLTYTAPKTREILLPRGNLWLQFTKWSVSTARD